MKYSIRVSKDWLLGVGLSLLCGFVGTATAAPFRLPPNNQFRKVVLVQDEDINHDGKPDDTLKDPMEMSLAPDGRVFFIERAGLVKVWDPKSGKDHVIGKIPVETKLEDGLLGIALDPHFLQNGFIYFYCSPPDISENHVVRFTMKNGKLDMASAKVILRVKTQRLQCCHSAGCLLFDKRGYLYISAGDNTNPFASDGYAPLDERPGRFPWDSQKSASNSNDLRGKVLRIKPNPDGTYDIPPGNLFPPGTPKTRPEIYAMGCRNPFRISVDNRTGYLYWGDVGPDAGGPNPKRGPAGYDEVNQARHAGFFGWPYFIANNKPYVAYNFATKTSGKPFDPQHPVNDSPNNTGLKNLPPAQPAFIYYPYGFSTKFPILGSGGRTAMAGPVYYYNPRLSNPHRLPPQFNHVLFIYEWTRNWIMAVKLDKNDHIQKIMPFLTNMTFKRPMDMKLGPDGCLYLIEYGKNWANNTDSKIERIEYVGPQIAGK